MKAFGIFHVLVLFTTFATAQIQHEGFLGSPFSGISMDSSGRVVNQVGPIADFAVPVGLSVHTVKSTLKSGETSPLKAALRLDDGSISHLEGIKWSSSSNLLSLESNTITALAVSKAVQVSVQATSHGFKAVLFLRLKPGQTASSVLQGTTLPKPIADALRQPVTGWRKSPWFGDFYQPDPGINWIHHEHHGWLYSAPAGDNSIWLWSPRQKWLWTGSAVYPHLYRNKDATWVYLMLNLPGNTYYNYSTKSFERESN